MRRPGTVDDVKGIGKLDALKGSHGEVQHGSVLNGQMPGSVRLGSRQE